MKGPNKRLNRNFPTLLVYQNAEGLKSFFYLFKCEERDLRIDSIPTQVSNRSLWPELAASFLQIQVQDVKKLQKFFVRFFESVVAALTAEQLSPALRVSYDLEQILKHILPSLK